MFLYAKIMLGSIELLNDMDEIRQELRVLPENLDDAYDHPISFVIQPIYSQIGMRGSFEESTTFLLPLPRQSAGLFSDG
jgi:hypothetical protein